MQPNPTLDTDRLIATLHRPVCDLLGCTWPLVSAGMGGVARSELVSAVTRAGGFGFLGMVREPVALIRDEVERVRKATSGPFGVNLIPAATPSSLLHAQVATCIELQVPAVALFWDSAPQIVKRLRDAGVLVVYQVGSLADARAAENAGAQILIVQGEEAGGHVRAHQPLHNVLSEVIPATRLPVLAAGGITDGEDMAIALALGAQGVAMGTALIPTHESFAHEYHKKRVIDALEDATVLTEAFHINWPQGARVRVLHNSVTRGDKGDPFRSEEQLIGYEQGRSIYLFGTDSPLRSMTGMFECMALYAGVGASRITTMTSVADRIYQVLTHAAAILDLSDESAETITTPAISQLDDPAKEQLAVLLNELLESERAAVRVASETFSTSPEFQLRHVVSSIRLKGARRCSVLSTAVRSLDAAPSRRTSSLYDEALAVCDVKDRLKFLNRSQEWITRKLQTLIPTISDPKIKHDLTMLLCSREVDTQHGDNHAASIDIVGREEDRT